MDKKTSEIILAFRENAKTSLRRKFVKRREQQFRSNVLLVKSLIALKLNTQELRVIKGDKFLRQALIDG